MTVVVVLLAIAVGVLALLVFGLLRTHAEILRALDRAGISLDDEATASSAAGVVAAERSEAAAVAGPEGARDLVGTVPAGGPTKVAVTGVAHLTLLAFLSAGVPHLQAVLGCLLGSGSRAARRRHPARDRGPGSRPRLGVGHGGSGPAGHQGRAVVRGMG